MKDAKIVGNYASIIAYAKAQGKSVLTPIRATENGVLFVHLFSPGKRDAEMLCFSKNASEGVAVGESLTKEQAEAFQIVELEYPDGERRIKISLNGGDNGYTALF